MTHADHVPPEVHAPHVETERKFSVPLILTAVCLAALFVTAIVKARSFPGTSGYYPRFVGVSGLLALAWWLGQLAFSRLFGRSTTERPDQEQGFAADAEMSVVTPLVLIIGYLLAVRVFGFWATTVVALPLYFWRFASSSLVFAISASAVTLGVLAGFGEVLDFSWPPGLLELG